MAIIDSEGLFHGDRFTRCSDLARLHWPFLFLASNGFGRLELNHRKIAGTVYSDFDQPINETIFYRLIEEYRQAHLLFVYQSEAQVWGQWWCKPEQLRRWKTAKDRKSPVPPEPVYSEWIKAYPAEKAKLPKFCAKVAQVLRLGVGVGVGVGKEQTIVESKDDSTGEQLALTPPEPEKPKREAEMAVRVFDYYRKVFGRTPAYDYDEKRKRLMRRTVAWAIKAVRDLEPTTPPDAVYETAEKGLRAGVDKCAADDFHKEKGLRDIEHVFGNRKRFDRWTNL